AMMPKSMRRGTTAGAVVAVGLATLLVVIGAWLGAETALRSGKAQAQQKQAPSSASCEGCHAGVEPMHANADLGCVECHGGDGAQAEKDKAHVQPRNKKLFPTSANPSSLYGAINLESPEFIRFMNPSDLRVADKVCGDCHQDIVDAVKRSIMATN